MRTIHIWQDTDGWWINNWTGARWADFPEQRVTDWRARGFTVIVAPPPQ